MPGAMGIGGTPYTGRQLARIGILFVAFMLAMISLFVAWWGVTATFGNAERSVDAKPFRGFEEGDDLGTEAVLTGVFALLGTLSLLAYLGLEIMEGLGRRFAPLFTLIPPAAAVLFGLTAVLYTAFAWPTAGSNDVGFFDSREASVPGLGTVKNVFSASLGWYFAIVGLIVAPAVTFWLSVKETGVPMMGKTTASNAAPAPAAAPMPAPAPAPTAPTPAATSPARVATKRATKTGTKK